MVDIVLSNLEVLTLMDYNYQLSMLKRNSFIKVMVRAKNLVSTARVHKVNEITHAHQFGNKNPWISQPGKIAFR